MLCSSIDCSKCPDSIIVLKIKTILINTGNKVIVVFEHVYIFCLANHAIKENLFGPIQFL